MENGMAERKKRFEIPPHIAWPGFIILLLLLSMVVSFGALIAARSDGGVDVVREPTEMSTP